MTNRGRLPIAAVLLLLLAAAGLARADEPGGELPEVDGVVGFDGPAETSWLAVRVPIPDGHAVSGVVWYNNDGLVVFPAVLVGTGYERGPGDVTEMTVLAEDVSGDSSDWSELAFSEPVVASQRSLYVVFAVPEESGFDGEGEGGGPGMGYCTAALGTPGWASTDGEAWVRLHYSAGFALVPVFVPVEEGMLVKSLGGEDQVDEIPIAQPYLTCGPNPFNPRTEIRFGLSREAKVELDIYDLRGRRVVRLLDGVMAAGPHTVVWPGVDGAGRNVASGMYFARLRFDGQKMTRKMMLVR